MRGFIINSNGGAAKVFATISVTYPAGATCTCSNGVKTLTAIDTSGQATFYVPSAGAWTVTATKGSQSKSSSVTISTENEVKTVTLSFTLVLFNAGKYAAETGGWTGISGSTLTSSTSCYDMDGVYQWTCQTENAVDLTNYTTLYFTVSSLSKSYYFTCRFGIGTSQRSHKSYVNISDTTTYSLNVSSRNSSFYLSLYHGGAANQNGAWDGNTTVKISKVWLE